MFAKVTNIKGKLTGHVSIDMDVSCLSNCSIRVIVLLEAFFRLFSLKINLKNSLGLCGELILPLNYAMKSLQMLTESQFLRLLILQVDIFRR